MSDPIESSQSRFPRPLGVTLIIAALGLLVARGLWSLIHSSDEQNAKLAATASIGITSVIILYRLQRWFQRSGRRWLVPSVLVASGLACVATIQFEGFSGEMLPQFRWRWAAAAPALQTVPSHAELPDKPSDPTIGQADPASEVRTNVPGVASRQFLGPSRNGVIERREFSIPQSAGEVEVLWDIGVGAGWASFAIADSLAVTLEQRDEDECLTAYDLETGVLRWIVRHPGNHFHALGGRGPRSTPTLVGDRVIAQTATGWVVCAELATGKIHWDIDLVAAAGWDLDASHALIPWGRSGSPLVWQDQVVVPFGGPASLAESGRSLIALDLATGETRWTSGPDQISYASPVLRSFDGVDQVVSVNEATVSGHQVGTGDLLWSFDWYGQTNAGANCSSVVPAGENRFLIGKGYSGGSSLVELTRSDGAWSTKEIWHVGNLLQTKFNHALVATALEPPTAFAIGNGSVEAVDLTEPRRLWRQPRSQRCGQGQAMRVDDVLVVQTEPGPVQFLAADPSEYRLLAEIPALESKTWNLPTLAGRYLLVRNDRRAIAMKLPEREPSGSDLSEAEQAARFKP